MNVRMLDLRCSRCGAPPCPLMTIELDEAGRCPRCHRAWVLFCRVPGMLLVLGVGLTLFAWILL